MNKKLSLSKELSNPKESIRSIQSVFSRANIVVAALLMAAGVSAAELWIGAAQANITPEHPISLRGQFHNRIATSIMSPCTANVLALESRKNGKPGACAILVSMDLCVIENLQDEFRCHLVDRLPEFNTNMLFLAATHTHTGPTLAQDQFLNYGEAMPPKEVVQFILERTGDAVIKAWESRKPGAVAWGLGHAVVGANRRVSYADSTAVMYGATDIPSFRNLEGWEDHSVDILLFYDANRKLVATTIAVPCPAQVVEGLSQVSADYWHPVRETLRKKHGSDLVVLGFCAPAGDQVPRPMLRKDAENRMLKLRKTDRMQEIARRITNTFEETLEVIQNDIRSDILFAHCVEQFEVPGRKLTEQEYVEAKKDYAEWSIKPATDPNAYARARWYKRTLERYEEQQKSDPKGTIEMHVLRIGDVAIATNPFELFVDYAMQIQGRSPAGQTVLIQLASPVGTNNSYLPSERAVKGGGYSAVPQSSPIGPEGGQILVERTLAAIRNLFDK
ncbi:MAG: hypothetical protein PHO37_04530 [Kiritimatiellae bacterium]|nr:hypothetical protein [Kiritimatiellia bacterium]